MKEKKTHIEIEAPLMEMADVADLASLVKVDANLIKEITDGDPNPQFGIVDIEEQKSGNNINYDLDAFQLIASQVNEKQPTGYLGHIKDIDKDTAFPDPQALWLGATAFKNAQGKAHIVAKCYLIPEGRIRGLIKRKVVNTVSWAGDAVLTPAREGGYKLREYILESIDFSRKNREGLKGQNLVVVTEMMNENKEGGKKIVAGDGDATYEEIVSRLVFADLKSHNPALVHTIQEMAKDEVKEEVATAVKAKEDELTEKHTKELEAVPEIGIVQKMRQLLGLKDDGDPIESLEAFLAHLDKVSMDAVREWFNSEILAKKVANEKARKLVARLIPVTEMQGDWRSERGIEKIKSDLEEKVDDVLENDDDIKVVLAEMGSNRGGLRLGEMKGHRDRQNDHRGDDDDPEAEEIAKRSGGRLKLEHVRAG